MVAATALITVVAVESGAISGYDANVNDWVTAANAMADSMGLAGEYSYTSDSSQVIPKEILVIL